MTFKKRIFSRLILLLLNFTQLAKIYYHDLALFRHICRILPLKHFAMQIQYSVKVCLGF